MRSANWPRPLQAKLLRVLQEREFERVGGTRPIKLDIRLITATNRDLNEASQAGTFRQDLFYRLNVVSIELPPLRERPEDIPLLAAYFTARYSEKVKRRVAGIGIRFLRFCGLWVDGRIAGRVFPLEIVLLLCQSENSANYTLDVLQCVAAELPRSNLIQPTLHVVCPRVL